MSKSSSTPPGNTLRITEIFHSLQGEARDVGWPTVFVRLTGCPLRCGYCDTAYAFTGGEVRAIDSILAEVAGYGAARVCVTGGEPLAQKNCLGFLTALCDAGYQVSLETSGALDVTNVDSRVVKVMDVKTPGSGEVDKNRYQNFALLSGRDQVKFVLCGRADYEFAKQLVQDHALDQRCEVLFSPSYGQLATTDLADWILRDRINVRFQLQLHKVLWGDARGK